MSRLQTMDYAADFLRGWPNEGALESSVYPIAAGVDLEAGDLVGLNASGELIKVAAETSFAGIVVRGNLDDKSVAGPTGGNLSYAPRKAIVLWGSYIVRTTKIEASVLAGAPMDPVIASVNGTFIRSGDATNITFAEANAASMGYVLELHPSAGGAPASAVIVVK